VIVVIHDSTIERTTNGKGYVNAMTFAELQTLDAAYSWTPDGGARFPLRGQGITIPSLSEVLKTFPNVRFNIEPKQGEPSLAAPLCQMLRENKVTDRVMVGSFKSAVLDEFRRACPEVATSASTSEVSAFLALSAASLEGTYGGAAEALQVPEYTAGLRVITPGLVEAAHRRDLQVHAWTINDMESMKRLLDFGVDGIITDYPDRLIELLNGRKVKPVRASDFVSKTSER
jgi:glycerophosphoryl diester phosphodiesterase